MSVDPALIEEDVAARKTALEVERSFIVQAPAGSGKTELLIQRYLRLLATVDDPEEILAITFTRKAAAEMRLRVLDALQQARAGAKPAEAHHRLTLAAARAALERDAALGWNLSSHARRMRIQTLDSLNASIARMRPLTAASAGSVSSVGDDSELDAVYGEAAAATLDWLGDRSTAGQSTEEVLLHLDNHSGRYIDYLSRMLRTRDQWLPFIAGGLISAGDSDRLRRALERGLEKVVVARLRALRAEVPDDAAAEFLALGAYAAENLVADGREDDDICRLVTAPGLPEDVDADPAAAVSQWRAIAALLLTKSGGVRKQVNKTVGFPPRDDGQKAAMTELLASIVPQEKFVRLLHDVRELPDVRYSDEQWSVLLALFRLLPLAVAELRRLCLARGTTDHIEIALAAGEALGSAESPGDVALLLDYQVRHILVDEMQDTSKAQYRMLEALTGGWEPGDGRTLFCVGDPMQSIYRFRNAEVSQFLLARENGIGSVELESLLLRQNFRSGERLVDWFNAVFPEVLPRYDDPAEGAVTYASAVPVETRRGAGEQHVYPLFGGSVEAEAAQGLAILERLRREHPGDSTAVLVRGRTQLPTLLAKLRDAGIRYQAVDIDRLTDLPEIIDVLALTRALSHHGDRVAWLALLRSPWIGLDWHDLHTLVAGRPQALLPELLRDEQRIAKLSGYGQRAARHALATLQPFLGVDRSTPLHLGVERAWYALGGPALMTDENAVANVCHYLDALARLEVAGSIPDVAALMQQLDAERVSASVTAPVQVLTMHKAKGLQFDHVVLYGLGRYPGGGRKSVMSWFDLPDEHGRESKVISPIGREDDVEHDPLHRFIERTEKTKEEFEQGRLLYVACTRAKRSLHLVGNVGVSSDGAEMRLPHAGSLLRLLWPALEGAYRAAFDAAEIHAADEDDNVLAEPPLRRMKATWQVPDVEVPGAAGRSVPVEAAPAEVDYYWVGEEARLAGTVVHRWLQLAAEGRATLSADRIDDTRSRSLRWLSELGAADAMLDAVLARVEQALRRMLDDDRGRWLLAGGGHAELALSGALGERIDSIVIDRVRIEEDGVHWIVDYKTSSHEGGDLDAFLAAEALRYREQLARYAAIYRAWSGAETRAALYFPLLARFVAVDV